MNCSICAKEISSELVYTITDTIVLSFFSVVLKGTHFAVCTDCFSKWNRILELLFQIFRENKVIDDKIMKRILNENIT